MPDKNPLITAEDGLLCLSHGGMAYDEKAGVVRMWFLMFGKTRFLRCMESRDGITWVKAGDSDFTTLATELVSKSALKKLTLPQNFARGNGLNAEDVIKPRRDAFGDLFDFPRPFVFPFGIANLRAF